MKAAREVTESEVFAAKNQALRALKVARTFRLAGIDADQVAAADGLSWALAAELAGLKSVPSRATQAMVLVLLEQGVNL